jgi:hypothetical protein
VEKYMVQRYRWQAFGVLMNGQNGQNFADIIVLVSGQVSGF